MENFEDYSVKLPVKFFCQNNIKDKESSITSKIPVEPPCLSEGYNIHHICYGKTGTFNLSLVKINESGDWILNSVCLFPANSGCHPIKLDADVTSGSSPYVSIYIPSVDNVPDLVMGPFILVITLTDPRGNEIKLTYGKIYISWAPALPEEFLLHVIEKEFGPVPDFKTVSEFLFGISKRWREFLGNIYYLANFKEGCVRHLHDEYESRYLQNLWKSKRLPDFVKWFCDTCTFYSLYDPNSSSENSIGRLLSEDVIHPYMDCDRYEMPELELLGKAQREGKDICLIRISSQEKSLAVCCLDKNKEYFKILIKIKEPYLIDCSIGYLWSEICNCTRKYDQDFPSFDILTTKGKVRSAKEVFGRQ